MPRKIRSRRKQPESQVSQATALDEGVIEAQLVGSDGQVHVGPPCMSCGAPREGSSKFCSACGAPLETRDVPALVAGESGADSQAVPSHGFQCQNCGSEVFTSVDQRSYVCPFCDSTYVTEIPSQRSGRQRPEFVIGFAVTVAQAKEKYFQWLGKNSWFRPGDLAQKAVVDKQKGVYLPFWHFSVYADSDWYAQIGEYWYRTETYTTTDSKGRRVTRTRQVRETEWFPLHGEHHRYYFGHMVPATRGITAEEATAIQPYQLTSMERYRPYFLAGWMAEEYSIDKPEALQQAEAAFRARQQEEIRRFLPGDTSSGLKVQTRFEVNGSDLVLLPVYVLSYRYRDQLYRFLVNGQTGRVVGQKPWSGKRIAAFVGFLLLILLAVILTFVFLTR